jgi:ABC-type sugar transport system ATPase subunit
MNNETAILSAKNIYKRFVGITALDNVSIDLAKGRVTALIGGNGAGKSTLVKILTGVLPKDSGEIYIDGKQAEIHSVDSAKRYGINVIHQIPQFAPHLTVLENVFLGKEIAVNKNFHNLSRIRKKDQLALIEPLLETYDADINPRSKLYELKAYQQRLIGILTALVNEARILILDEPTAALPLKEREKLLANIKKLKANDYAILYVSHLLDEIEEIADEVVAIRDGKFAGMIYSNPESHRMIELMTGNSLSGIENMYDDSINLKGGRKKIEGTSHGFLIFPPKRETTSIVDETLEFSFHKNEIVLLTGIIGSGVQDVARAMYGADSGWEVQYSAGENNYRIMNPLQAIRSGVGYLSDDRRWESTIPSLSIRKNLTIPAINKIGNFFGHIFQKKEKELAVDLCNKLNVKYQNTEQGILELSGGNQQKVMLGRWLFAGVDFLILNEPTQGIDVMAKKEVIKLLNDFIRDGGSCLIITTDPEEFLHAASRVVVMRKGKVVGEYSGKSIQKTEIFKTMLMKQKSEE